MAHYFFRSDEHQAIFATSPKCATQSIRHWLNRLLLGREGETAGLDRLMVPHQQLRALPDYRLILFMRDPLRRLVSFYGMFVVRLDYAQHWRFADVDRRFDLTEKSFRQFVHILHHLKTHRFARQHHLVPQLAGFESRAPDLVLSTDALAESIGRLNAEFGTRAAVPHRHEQSYGPPLADAMEWTRDRIPCDPLPAPASFFDDELRETACGIYAEDVAIHRREIGPLLGEDGLAVASPPT
ncbi:MAG: sulfotransferase family 2 domain-containing protein [Pseudomonadota bacterium]